MKQMPVERESLPTMCQSTYPKASQVSRQAYILTSFCFYVLLISVWDCLFNEASHIPAGVISLCHMLPSRHDQPEFSVCLLQASVIMLGCYLNSFFPTPGRLLISLQIEPCNLSRACLLMIHDMFPVFFPLQEPWFLMILHIFAWHILSREFLITVANNVFRQLFLFIQSAPVFRVHVAFLYPTHFIFTNLFFPFVK